MIAKTEQLTQKNPTSCVACTEITTTAELETQTRNYQAQLQIIRAMRQNPTTYAERLVSNFESQGKTKAAIAQNKLHKVQDVLSDMTENMETEILLDSFSDSSAFAKNARMTSTDLKEKDKVIENLTKALSKKFDLKTANLNAKTFLKDHKNLVEPWLQPYLKDECSILLCAWIKNKETEEDELKAALNDIKQKIISAEKEQTKTDELKQTKNSIEEKLKETQNQNPEVTLKNALRNEKTAMLQEKKQLEKSLKELQNPHQFLQNEIMQILRKNGNTDITEDTPNGDVDRTTALVAKMLDVMENILEKSLETIKSQPSNFQ